MGEGPGPNSGWFMRSCEEARASGYVALRHRALRSVPEVIALCDAATDVDLSDNAISTLPCQLHWHALVACTLANNVLEELPVELPLPLGTGTFDHLLQLNLSGNLLSSSVRHVTWLWQLSALTHLDMSLNPLACDIALEGLKSLQHCCMRQVLATNCPANPPLSLTHLDLSRNALRQLPGHLQRSIAQRACFASCRALQKHFCGVDFDAEALYCSSFHDVEPLSRFFVAAAAAQMAGR